MFMFAFAFVSAEHVQTIIGAGYDCSSKSFSSHGTKLNDAERGALSTCFVLQSAMIDMQCLVLVWWLFASTRVLFCNVRVNEHVCWLSIAHVNARVSFSYFHGRRM